jgi:hypothetical protein
LRLLPAAKAGRRRTEWRFPFSATLAWRKKQNQKASDSTLTLLLFAQSLARFTAFVWYVLHLRGFWDLVISIT